MQRLEMKNGRKPKETCLSQSKYFLLLHVLAMRSVHEHLFLTSKTEPMYMKYQPMQHYLQDSLGRLPDILEDFCNSRSTQFLQEYDKLIPLTP